jgi:hypothetical protein
MICADRVCVDVPVLGDAIAEKQEVRTPETPLCTHHHCIQKNEVYTRAKDTGANWNGWMDRQPR